MHQDTPVRLRTEADLPGCADALREVYEADGYPVEGVADAEDWLQPDSLIKAWVTGTPDSITGHVAVCRPNGEAAVSMLMTRTTLTEDQIAVIARLFVTPGARGQGLGVALAAAAWQYAERHGRRVVFDVMKKDQAAIRLYERLGCVRLGETTHVFGSGRQTPAYCYVTPGQSTLPTAP